MIFNYPHEFIRYVKAGEASVIGITSGCFDVLHTLHVDYLEKCSRECDELYVFIDSDKLVSVNKGEAPYINQRDRAFMVDLLKTVTGVIIMDSLDLMNTCILSVASEKRHVKVIKKSATIYGKPLITYDSAFVENVVIPDVVRFGSSSEIKKGFKQK